MKQLIMKAVQTIPFSKRRDMEISKELLEKAEQAQNAEELLKMAEEAGIVLSPDSAEKYFQYLHGGNELPDEALEMIAGGKGPKWPDPKYKVGQKLKLGWPRSTQEVFVVVLRVTYYDKEAGHEYEIQNLDNGEIWYEWLDKRQYVYT